MVLVEFQLIFWAMQERLTITITSNEASLACVTPFQLTNLRIGYPPTSIIWPYHGLKTLVTMEGVPRQPVFCEKALVIWDVHIKVNWGHRRLVGSFGRAPVCWAGGHGFEPRPDQHSGSLNKWKESAAFVMTSENG